MKPSKIKSRAKSCAFRVTMRTEPCGWSNCPSIPFSFLPSSYLRSFHKSENRIHSSSPTSKLLPASDVTIDPLTVLASSSKNSSNLPDARKLEDFCLDNAGGCPGSPNDAHLRAGRRLKKVVCDANGCFRSAGALVPHQNTYFKANCRMRGSPADKPLVPLMSV